MKTICRLSLSTFPPAALIPALLGLYEGITRMNVAFLRASPKTPLLLKSGVRWRREGSPEIVKTIPEILRDGYDDCEGLASWRAAELRVRFNKPSARVMVYQARPKVWHAIVEDPRTGRHWDPSRQLGMRGSA